jgi:hypothetical protein
MGKNSQDYRNPDLLFPLFASGLIRQAEPRQKVYYVTTIRLLSAEGASPLIRDLARQLCLRSRHGSQPFDRGVAPTMRANGQSIALADF